MLISALLLVSALAGPAASRSSASLADAPPAASDSAGPPLAGWIVLERDSAYHAPASLGTLDVSGIATDAFGRMFVTDALAHRLVRLDAHGRWLGAEGTLGSADGQFRRPGAVAPYGTLEIAVLDRENRRIARYDFLGHWKGILVDLQASELEQRLGRVDPIDMACDQGGAQAVVDRDGERVLLFDAAGEFLRALGGYGDRAGSFRGLAGVAFTARGDLLVSERIGRRVQRLDSGGRPMATWPLPSAGRNGALPIATRADGAVVVADESGGALWVFDDAGRLRATLSHLAAPRALAFAPDGTLLVAEGGSARIRRFTVAPAAGDSARAE